ncbi:MAG: GNAT family N-acetyltransferase, partial [Ilumatobacteraceae bacterium]
MGTHPPEQVTVDGITVRRWRVDDAVGLHEIIIASVEHLRPWMPWVAGEPLVVADREALLSAWVDDWDAGRGFTFAVTDATGALLGSCGLHRRGDTDGLEIGYWVRAGRTGAGVATAVAGALVRAASCVDGIDHVEIHHDRDNVASGRV